MKNLYIFSLLFLCIAACKKSDIPEQTKLTPEEAFAVNVALIDPKAKVYFIADVEGHDSITKIIANDTKGCVSAGFGGGSCTTGSSHYSGDVGCPTTGINWNLGIDYYGKGESRENLITKGFTVLKTIKAEAYGVRIIYTPFKGKPYYSNLLDNSLNTWANIELLEMTPSGGSPPYYIKLRFNCELKEFGGTKILRLKNAVARVKI